MGDRKNGEEGVRKINRMGNGSLGITLPIGMLRALKWREGHKVSVVQKGRSLLVRGGKKNGH